MSLRNEFEASGNWLFAYRSYLPLFILPLLFYLLTTPLPSDTLNLVLIVGLSISCIGEFIRIFTIAFIPYSTSGRNTKQQHTTSLNIKGTYSIVRHPLYLGNFLIYLGPFIYTGNFYGIIIFILIFWIYYERIMFAEEAFLINKFGNEYAEWSSKTPALMPNIKLFSSNRSKFSVRKVLLREYSGICGICAMFTGIIIFRNYIYNNIPVLSNNWKIVFFTNGIIYLVLRTYKKISYNNKVKYLD